MTAAARLPRADAFGAAVLIASLQPGQRFRAPWRQDLTGTLIDVAFLGCTVDLDAERGARTAMTTNRDGSKREVTFAARQRERTIWSSGTLVEPELA